MQNNVLICLQAKIMLKVFEKSTWLLLTTHLSLFLELHCFQALHIALLWTTKLHHLDTCLYEAIYFTFSVISFNARAQPGRGGLRGWSPSQVKVKKKDKISDNSDLFCVPVIWNYVIWPIYGLKIWLLHSKTLKSHMCRHFYEIINITSPKACHPKLRHKKFPFSNPSLSKILIALLSQRNTLLLLLS